MKLRIIDLNYTSLLSVILYLRQCKTSSNTVYTGCKAVILPISRRCSLEWFCCHAGITDIISQYYRLFNIVLRYVHDVHCTMYRIHACNYDQPLHLSISLIMFISLARKMSLRMILSRNPPQAVRLMSFISSKQPPSSLNPETYMVFPQFLHDINSNLDMLTKTRNTQVQFIVYTECHYDLRDKL